MSQKILLRYAWNLVEFIDQFRKNWYINIIKSSKVHVHAICFLLFRTSLISVSYIWKLPVHMSCGFHQIFIFVLTCSIFYLFFIFLIYETYCQIGFHTTPSAHPKRCPPQYPSPTLSSLPPPINPQFVFSFEQSLMLWLSPTLTSFFFSSPAPWAPVKFLRIHIRVKPYGICLSLYGLCHLASHCPVPSTLLQKAIFHFSSLPRSMPLCI